MIETDEHQLFRKTLRDLFEREIEPHVDEWEAARTFPAHDLFPKLAAVGIFGLEYEEAYGGMGADHTFSMIAGEEMGRISCGGIPMAMAVQMAMSTPALARYGSHELKEQYLAPAVRGEVVTSIAVTEPDAGSDVAGIRTRAVRDGDEWVINGSKLYITNGTQADWLCLLARTSDDPGYGGMSLIVVPTALDGVAVSRKLEKLGMWSSDTAELSFTDVRVPVSNTIGEIGRGFQQQMVQFQAERLMTFYKQVGSIALALARTREYLRERKAFGAPLLANQHLQFVLAELSARHDVLKEYARTTADAVVRGEDATRYATIGKLLGSRLQREVADYAVQFHGGIGYMDEHWTSRYFRDTRLDSIGAGADEVMLRILARMDGYTTEQRLPPGVAVARNYFDESIAERYRTYWPHLFDPSVVDPCVDFLAQLAEGGTALEFGVGTGRIAVPLSGRGVPVHGIELSPAMVAKLRAEPGSDGVEVTIGDFATTAVDGTFRLAYLLRNTLANLTTQDEQVACFLNAARHLEPGGCFVIELYVPELRRLPPGETIHPFDATPTHLGFEEYDVATQTATSHHYWFVDGHVETFSAPFRYAWPSELDLMARLAGLTPRERYADWDRSPFTNESRSHVSVWEKAGEGWIDRGIRPGEDAGTCVADATV